MREREGGRYIGICTVYTCNISRQLSLPCCSVEAIAVVKVQLLLLRSSNLLRHPPRERRMIHEFRVSHSGIGTP